MKTSLLPALLLLTQCTPLLPRAALQAPQQSAYLPQEPVISPPATPAVNISAPVTKTVWQRQSALRSQSLPGGAQWHEFTATGPAESAEVCVIIFNSRDFTLRIVDQPSANAGGSVISSLMRRVGAVAGVNGGFFHPDFSPLGLMICDGQKTGQFAKTGLISGSLIVIGQEPYLTWNHEYLGENRVSQLLQAGPRLVDSGHALPSLNRTKAATRTFIATDGKRRWAIGTVRSTSLAGLAELLISDNVLPDIQVQRALNLDGGHSTAIYARKTDGQEISDPGWSTVRSYLAVVPR